MPSFLPSPVGLRVGLRCGAGRGRMIVVGVGRPAAWWTFHVVRSPSPHPSAGGSPGAGLPGGGGCGPGQRRLPGSPAGPGQQAGIRRLSGQWGPSPGPAPAAAAAGGGHGDRGAAGRRSGLHGPLSFPPDRGTGLHQSHPAAGGPGGRGGVTAGGFPAGGAPGGGGRGSGRLWCSSGCGGRGRHRGAIAASGAGDRGFLQPQHRQGDARGAPALHDHWRLPGAGAGLPRPCGAAAQPCGRLGHPVRHADYPSQAGGARGPHHRRCGGPGRSRGLLPPGQAALR